MTAYKPTEEDIQWLQNNVNLLRDGGAIAYPSAGCIFRVDKGKKVLITVNRGDEETWQRTVVVAGEIGWVVQ
jgi:hypothetical protein